MRLQPGSMPSIFRKDCRFRRGAAQPRTEWGTSSLVASPVSSGQSQNAKSLHSGQ